MSIRESVVTVGNLRFPLREAGPLDGEPVVLLHGFPDCLHTFDEQLRSLGEAGYRAIAPALRGYSAAAIPADGDYFLETIADELPLLLDALGLRQVHLVGHDWGAAIAWLAVVRHPRHFRTVTSLAIPPLGGLLAAIRRFPSQARNSWYMAFFQLRGLSDFVVRRDDFAFIDRLWRDWSPGWSWPAEAMEPVKETFRQPGVPAAALGYYRHLFRWLAAPNRRTRADIARPVTMPALVLHGQADGCMDARLPAAAVQAARFEAGVQLAIVPGAGHFLHREQPVRVNALLLEFLAANPVRPS